MKYYRPLVTWSSNALEGNTIPLSETQIILEDGITVHGHTLREINECVGHGEAYDYMFSLIRQKCISEENVKKLLYLFARNIKDIPHPGEYCDVSRAYVYITDSEYPCPDYSKLYAGPDYAKTETEIRKASGRRPSAAVRFYGIHSRKRIQTAGKIHEIPEHQYG